LQKFETGLLVNLIFFIKLYRGLPF